MYQYVINNIIPADDLHWSEEEGKYVSLSKEELDEIIAACLSQGLTNLKDVMKVIQWCGNIRVGQILWKNLLLGSVEITGFDRNDEPRFGPRKDEQNDD